MFAALRLLLELASIAACALIRRWLVDVDSSGLSGATLGLGVLRAVKAEPRRGMAGPSGASALTHLARVAAQQQGPAAAAHNQALLLQLTTNRPRGGGGGDQSPRPGRGG